VRFCVLSLTDKRVSQNVMLPTRILRPAEAARDIGWSKAELWNKFLCSCVIKPSGITRVEVLCKQRRPTRRKAESGTSQRSAFGRATSLPAPQPCTYRQLHIKPCRELSGAQLNRASNINKGHVWLYMLISATYRLRQNCHVILQLISVVAPSTGLKNLIANHNSHTTTR